MNDQITITYESCYRGKIEIHTDQEGKVVYWKILR
jgi:hypothetical protein